MDVALMSTSAEVGIDREDRTLLRRRCRLTFALGFLVTAGLLAAGEILGLLTGEAAPSASERWVYVAYLAVFVVGFFGMLPGGSSAARLHAIASGVVAALLLVLAADTVLHVPDYPPLALVALILFGAAALIPWPATFQAGLVATSLVAVPVMRLTLDQGVGSAGWWS